MIEDQLPVTSNQGMETIKNFYDLETWKAAHQLALQIYRITKNFPKDELYGIVSQLRRAASSVGANIAEGFERYYYKDKVRFYHQARASVAEVQNFLFLSRDLAYIDDKIFDDSFEKLRDIGKLLNGLIK